MCPSFLKHDEWQEELGNDGQADFILNGIKYGFDIIDKGSKIKVAEMDNYSSALERRFEVERQLRTEIQEGRYKVCQEKPILISALGAIDKPNGGIRLITDCSQPKNCGAVNEYANHIISTKYQTVDDAVNIIRKFDCPYLAKVDLKSAYRSVAISRNNYPFMGLKWRFTGDKYFTYFYDIAMCFGSRKAPGIFHTLTQAVRRMMKRKGYDCVVYLDDFLIIAPSQDECQKGLSTLISLLRKLGFAIAWDKVIAPTMELIFLGININTRTKSLSLPQEKVQQMFTLLASFAKKKRASLKQLQQLAGKLAWCSRVVNIGRIYLQRVLDIMRPLQISTHKVVLTEEFKKDIHWWIQYLHAFNCKTYAPIITQEVVIQSDACSQGAGVLIPDFDWMYAMWKCDLPHMSNMHITCKETMAVILGIYRWAPLLRDTLITVETDNVYTKAVMNKGACKNEFIMHHLRYVGWLSVIFNFKINCVHVKGTNNITADCVSRLTERGNMLHWFSKLCNGMPYSNADVMLKCAGHMSPLTLCCLMSQARRHMPLFRD